MKNDKRPYWKTVDDYCKQNAKSYWRKVTLLWKAIHLYWTDRDAYFEALDSYLKDRKKDLIE